MLLLDDDADLRETMRDVIRLEGRECLGVGTFAELVELGDRIFDSSLAILDINLGPASPSGVDAYQWLRERGFEGRIVFLTGHARTHPRVDEAHRLGDARVLQKPILAGQLRALVAKEGRG